MLRAAFVSIVLTLAAGPNVALLCDAWCDPGTGTARACEHHPQATAPEIAANDDCTISGNPAVLVREDGRRSASAPDLAGATAVVRFAFTPPAAGVLSAYEPDSRLQLELRPLVLALRI